MAPTAREEIAALSEFNANARMALREFMDVALAPAAAPEQIFHYTNDHGLRGIVESGTIWLTNVFKLNDPSELKHGFSLLMLELDRRMEGRGPVCRRFSENMRQFFIHSIDNVAHIFTGSFSADRDDLGQWRAYGDNGCGFALGFETSAINSGYTDRSFSHASNNYAFNIRYCDEELESIQATLVDLAVKVIDVIAQRLADEERTDERIRVLCASLSR